MTIYIIIVIALLFSAFFSSMEIAFVASNKLIIKVENKQRTLASRIITYFVGNSEKYISTMLVGNNIALVVYGFFMSKLLQPMIYEFVTNDIAGLIIQTAISATIILITAEFLPKTLTLINPNLLLRMFSFPLIVFYYILYPISIITSAISSLFLRIVGIKVSSKDNKMAFDKVDLNNFLNQIENDNQESTEKEKDIEIFRNALDFSKVKLKECILPRNEICAVDINESIENLKQKFIETGFSKILIYKENIDNIIGYFTSLDIFKNPKTINSKIKNIIIVPETMTAKKMLEIFINSKKNIAVVVDEFGGTAGIVTVEDIVEEIFGEIEDEHDKSNYTCTKLSETEYIFSGRLEIDYLNSKFDLGFMESEEYETLAGFIFHHYESMPNTNDVIKIENYTFTIRKVTQTKIEIIHLLVSPKSEE